MKTFFQVFLTERQMKQELKFMCDGSNNKVALNILTEHLEIF